MCIRDRLKSVHPAFGKVTKSTVLNGFGAPLHPGALKYYREIGVPGIEDFVKRTADYTITENNAKHIFCFALFFYKFNHLG